MWIRYSQKGLIQLLVMNQVVTERSEMEYIHRLIREDIEKQLLDCDELDELILLDALKVIYANEDHPELGAVRQRLYRLKSKYRRQLQRQRAKVLESYGLSTVPLKSV